MYLEMTDPKEIEAAQKVLSKQLSKELPYKKHRTIGYPSGYFKTEVRFADKQGDDVSWWLGTLHKSGQYLNLFGRGNPNSDNTLLIDLQFNFSQTKFTRSHGGVFVKHLQTGEIALGHRGIVTRGKSRVPRDLLLQEANVSPFQVTSNIRPGMVDALVVAPINKAGIISDIREFSVEIRRAASLVMQSSKNPNNTPSNGTTPVVSILDRALRDYFDEFIGKTTSNRAGGQISIDCRHGAIVRALRDNFKDKGELYKSQTIDLVVETKNQVIVFEVKTGTNTQSIYTAVGQLYVHGAALARKFPKKEVIRYLVLPINPQKNVSKSALDELGIHLLPFRISGQKVTFSPDQQ